MFFGDVVATVLEMNISIVEKFWMELNVFTTLEQIGDLWWVRCFTASRNTCDSRYTCGLGGETMMTILIRILLNTHEVFGKNRDYEEEQGEEDIRVRLLFDNAIVALWSSIELLYELGYPLNEEIFLSKEDPHLCLDKEAPMYVAIPIIPVCVAVCRGAGVTPDELSFIISRFHQLGTNFSPRRVYCGRGKDELGFLCDTFADSPLKILEKGKIDITRLHPLTRRVALGVE